MAYEMTASQAAHHAHKLGVWQGRIGSIKTGPMFYDPEEHPLSGDHMTRAHHVMRGTTTVQTGVNVWEMVRSN